MKEYKFNGDWNPKETLDVLVKLGDDVMFDPNGYQQWIRQLNEDHKANKVQFRIYPAYNSNQFPEEIQINAINYILNNEDVIYAEIYKKLINVIHPYYSNWFGEYFDPLVLITNIDEMPNTLGLVDIHVEITGSKELAWCCYNFAWKGDEEHGLSMLFEGSKFIKHSSNGDMWVDDLVAEENKNYFNDLRFKDMPNAMYYPNVERKYYKPWELEKSQDFLLDLLTERRNVEFESIVSSEGFNVNQKFSWDEYPLIEILLRNGYTDSAHFLAKLGAHIDGIIHNGQNLLENIERIQFVYDNKGNIDERDKMNQTLLAKYLIEAQKAIELNNKKNDDNLSWIEQFEIAQRDKKSVFKKKMKIYKDHIELLIKYGASIDNNHKVGEALKYFNI